MRQPQKQSGPGSRHRRSAANRIARAALLAVLVGGCTDVGLYQWKHDPFQANKVTISGTVCTDDPRQRNFPVKIMFIIDSSLSVQADENDPTGYRGKAVDQVLSDLGKNANYHFGLIAFAGKPRNLIEEGFTQDSAKLSAAAAAVQGSLGVSGCFAGRCRDIRAATSLASSVITGDILAGDPGALSRTSYIVVLFSNGSPIPPIGRCSCRDRQSEQLPENWKDCPWDECDGCKVTCPPNSECKDTLCFPICDPECPDRQYCDSDFLCKEPNDDDAPLAGTPTVPPLRPTPVSIPDTFTYWVLPQQHGLDLSQVTAADPSATAGACVASCVYYPGGGHTDSCEERLLVNEVRELKLFAKKNGAAGLQFHTAYLPDKVDYSANQTSPFAPLCNDPVGEQERARRLLSEMAFAGDGGFIQYNLPEVINFADIDLHTTRDPLVIKELVVTNGNVIATSTGILPDTDQDGLDDSTEAALGTCPNDRDTDGDGIADAVEVKVLGSSPLTPDDPIECIDLEFTLATNDDICNPIDPNSGPTPCDGAKQGCGPGELECVDCPTTGFACDGASCVRTWRTYEDRDQDTLNACEERLLGTIDSLVDSDADGLPDKVEFVGGTNYLAVDPLQDIDFDGMVNREEIRGHTDARSNDAQSSLDLAYRYEEVDLGIKEVLSFSQPPTITGVKIKNASSKSGPGVGFLRFDPGPPARISWKDARDTRSGGDFGAWVDISAATNAEGLQVTSCRKGSDGECTEESLERFITVLAEGPANYPPKLTVDKIIISSALRNCLQFRVRNITLLETDIDPVLRERGNNNVYVYFSQAPKNAKEGFGIFRINSQLLNYIDTPSGGIREPRIAEITLTDDDFVLFE